VIPKPQRVDDVPGIPPYLIEKLREKNNSVALVIPVINEGQRIINQIKKIEILAPKIDLIIADGGSTDESSIFFRSQNDFVSTVLTNYGDGKLSEQLRMAFHYCLVSGYKSVITMDGNDKDGESGINEILAALWQGFDFVQGSRFIKGGTARNTPLFRLLAIRLIHAPLTSLAAKRWFTDTTNGFRGISIKIFMDKNIAYNREVFNSYELLAYLPIRAAQLGYKCLEVPVSRCYPFKQKVPTKIKGFKGPTNLVLILLRAVFGRYNPH